MNNPVSVCTICMNKVSNPIAIVLDGCHMVAHQRCWEAMREEVANSGKEGK